MSRIVGRLIIVLFTGAMIVLAARQGALLIYLAALCWLVCGVYWIFKKEKICGAGNDDKEEIKACRRAAKQGDAEAQLNLGLAYYFGNGVKGNNKEAAKWWRRAAEQGEVLAQWLLGAAYHKGEGVRKDDKEAARWWRKAADQGHAEAQRLLNEHDK
jgi:TPR repeat protein